MVVPGGGQGERVTVRCGTACDCEAHEVVEGAEEDHHEEADDPVGAVEEHHEDVDGPGVDEGDDIVHPEEADHEGAHDWGNVGQAHHAEEALEVEDGHEAVDEAHGKTAQLEA